MSVCRTVSEIFSVKEWRDLETGGRVIQVHWKWRHSIDHIYDFRLVFRAIKQKRPLIIYYENVGKTATIQQTVETLSSPCLHWPAEDVLTRLLTKESAASLINASSDVWSELAPAGATLAPSSTPSGNKTFSRISPACRRMYDVDVVGLTSAIDDISTSPRNANKQPVVGTVLTTLS